MTWPQVAMIALLALTAGLDMARASGWRDKNHGKETDGFYAMRFFIRPTIWGSLLYFGGVWP